MKLYTGTGDDGHTVLADGTRVSKDASQVRAYGCLDELNAYIGWCRCLTSRPLTSALEAVQSDLFVLSAELATPPGRRPGVRPLAMDAVRRLEGWIDAAWDPLPPLQSFILPGGCELSCRLHIARTCCRRAEREVVSLSNASAVRPEVLVYLNRLSDLLFAWARQANSNAQHPEVLWPIR